MHREWKNEKNRREKPGHAEAMKTVAKKCMIGLQ